MAESSSSPSSTAVVASPLSTSMKDNRGKVGSMMEELDKSRSELLTRLQVLKQDMQCWRSKLDTQVRTYNSELSELKSSLSTELEQLRSEFQEFRTTLQQQQEDVANSLKNLGIEDASKDAQYIKGNEQLKETVESQNIPHSSGDDEERN